VDLTFLPLVAGEAFSCSAHYAGLGTTKTTASPLDFRLYVHDVELIARGGERVPVLLDEDGTWQRSGVALLDFEDSTGSCNTGSPETNAHVRGTVPEHGDYVGVTWQVGLPPAMNHLDAATAPAPLNAPGMWWSWQGGFKYMRVDMATPGNPNGFFFHLGATSCDGGVNPGFNCKYENVSSPVVMGFSLDKSQIALDVAPLYSGVDLDKQPDYKTDFVAGCMAFSGDPECPAMLAPLQLGFEGAAVATADAAPMFSAR
jgi:uncharacterized repeat protein (TIGR04052 family)